MHIQSPGLIVLDKSRCRVGILLYTCDKTICYRTAVIVTSGKTVFETRRSPFDVMTYLTFVAALVCVTSLRLTSSALVSITCGHQHCELHTDYCDPLIKVCTPCELPCSRPTVSDRKLCKRLCPGYNIEVARLQTTTAANFGVANAGQSHIPVENSAKFLFGAVLSVIIVDALVCRFNKRQQRRVTDDTKDRSEATPLRVVVEETGLADTSEFARTGREDPCVMDGGTGPLVTDRATDPHVTDRRTGHRVTDPHVTDNATDRHATDRGTGRRVTDPHVTDTATDPHATDRGTDHRVTDPHVTDIATDPRVTDRGTNRSAADNAVSLAMTSP